MCRSKKTKTCFPSVARSSCTRLTGPLTSIFSWTRSAGLLYFVAALSRWIHPKQKQQHFASTRKTATQRQDGRAPECNSPLILKAGRATLFFLFATGCYCLLLRLICCCSHYAHKFQLEEGGHGAISICFELMSGLTGHPFSSDISSIGHFKVYHCHINF